ncbi:ferredoxin subunit of nitrite reductase and ring-hydroxylating dioxygenase [Beggiatoa alba B18LD]|uniref:Ferredoxin subunit of nitrite reductase and ring-hydroxylating dioxygenase n=1 Tax=Beggiatoa alba B18LD TaxID=395493 RepID=I3CJB9_9GAMM|nr:Rieske 2Fe-2S domain-containing protein [Beggiatoa alba]EIJ43712.1 ferredoxin subunit of nitrite reductase and ring-hydroxylating dioxygenase [Beggiatoa alba B18LD]
MMNIRYSTIVNSQPLSRLRNLTEKICHSYSLPERGKQTFWVIHRSSLQEALLIRYKGQVYAYLNRCLYEGEPLDSEDGEVFDASGNFLCSSHNGICYDPRTGECFSPIALGEKLIALSVYEFNGMVFLKDKQATLANKNLLQFPIGKNTDTQLFIQNEYSCIYHPEN